MRKSVAEIVFDILSTLFILFCVAILLLLLADVATSHEVESYTVGCEVTQLAYAEKTVSRAGSREVYKMGIRNDDFATTLEISASDFARYVVGDVVEIEVVVLESCFGVERTEYNLIK